jgi:HEAT repeat protein
VLLRQLLEICAFFPPGKDFVVDDIFPLCDLDVLQLDLVTGRTALETLLGACVRYGLLDYAHYTERYTTGSDMIQQALQAVLYPVASERQAVARRRQLATAVMHHMQHGDGELLGELVRFIAAEEGDNAPTLLAPYLVAPLRRRLGQSTREERQHMAGALGQFPSPLALDLLQVLLSDEEGQVRSRAAQSLADLEGLDTLPVLLKALKDRNGDVRWIVAQALGRLEGATTVDALIEMLADEDKEVGRIAAQGLGQKGDRRAVPHLLTAVRDSYPLLRESAASALGHLADQRALPALEELLQDANLQVRRSAETALARLLPASG